MRQENIKNYFCIDCRMVALTDAQGRCEFCRNRGKSLAAAAPSNRYAAEIILITAGVIVAILLFFFGR